MKFSILNEYYSYITEKREKMPKKRGFYIEHNPFRMEWDEELEK